jgi:hypothetical protein
MNMKKNLLFAMSAVLLLMAAMVMTACSDDEVNGIVYKKEKPKMSRGELNAFEIASEDGETETCWLNPTFCGKPAWSYSNTEPDGSSRSIYPLIFSAEIMNSSNFNVMQIFIQNTEMIPIDSLKVGDTFDATSQDWMPTLSTRKSLVRFRAWQETSTNGVIRIQNSPLALDGQVEVVDKRTADDGQSYITLNLQNLKLNSWSACCLKTNHIFNGIIEFPISKDGIYPDDGYDPESMRMPKDELDFFMMDALHGSEFEGRRTFFSEEAVAEECLIINSEEEFRQAYKGDKELPNTGINFDYCTLVIGRTYGEHGGVTYGGHELKDNGDSYQLNVTLNNNVNPDYCYTAAFTDIYFWNIYLKKEKKSVVFNRIRQDVTIDPLIDANSRLVGRWLLDGYSDGDDRYAGGRYHYCDRKDKGFYIEFKADGTVIGRINDINDLSCRYMVPYIGKRAYYEDAVEHGIINLWDWNITNVADDNPISEKMTHISKATQIKLIKKICLTLYVSPNEYYVFRRDNQ